MRSAALSPGTLSVVVSLTTYEIVATFVCSLAFIALYTLLAPWWRSPLGRNIVAMESALALTTLPSVVHHLFGFRPAQDAVFAWFTVVAFALVPCVIAWRAVIMVRLQRSHLRDVHDPPDGPPVNRRS